MGEAVLIASGKGGVGKTTIATNLGATLALRGASVVLVDLNMSLRNLDLYLGLENEILFDMADVLSGLCSISKSLVRDPRFQGLYLLSGAQCKEVAGLTPAHMAALIVQLKKRFDVVLADGPSGVPEHLRCAAVNMDRAIVVVTPDHSSLRNGDMVDKKLQEIGVENRCYLVNKVIPELFGRNIVPDLEDMAGVFATPMAGVVSYDENVHIANNRGYPIVSARDSYIAGNFDRIAQKLFG
ncbi:MAG TPA: P-loop NTPase [Clostridiales bacterium]|nr:P-loop NTPase [Clostridiales bacterium]